MHQGIRLEYIMGHICNKQNEVITPKGVLISVNLIICRKVIKDNEQENKDILGEQKRPLTTNHRFSNKYLANY